MSAAYDSDSRLPIDAAQELCQRLHRLAETIARSVNKLSPVPIAPPQIIPAASIREMARLAPTSEAELKKVEGMAADVRGLG